MSRILSNAELTPQRPDWVAGAPGFEPGNGGIKIRCLTAWLRPIGQSRSRPDDSDGGRTDQRPSRLRAPGARGYIGALSAKYRSVAQPGSAPRSGRGGRRFKSCHSDQSLAATWPLPSTRAWAGSRTRDRVQHNPAEPAQRYHAWPAGEPPADPIIARAVTKVTGAGRQIGYQRA